jgi:hypothetical protein
VSQIFSRIAVVPGASATDRLELLLKQIKTVEAVRGLAVEQTAKPAPAAMLLVLEMTGLRWCTR